MNYGYIILFFLLSYISPAFTAVALAGPRREARLAGQQQRGVGGQGEEGYTHAEIQRNAVLRKLGLPVEPPKARRSVMEDPGDDGVLQLRPFQDVGMGNYASKGYIGIHKDSISGPLLGYLDCHRLVPSMEDATLYAFIQAGPVMEIRVVGTQYRLAVTTGPLGVDLGPYSDNFHLPRHTLFSSIPGAGPNHDKVQSYLYETSVFTQNPDGGEIEVQWVNRNGQYTNIEIGLMDNRIYFTGDIRAFRTFTNRKVDHVELRWYPLE